MFQIKLTAFVLYIFLNLYDLIYFKKLLDNKCLIIKWHLISKNFSKVKFKIQIVTTNQLNLNDGYLTILWLVNRYKLQFWLGYVTDLKVTD